MDARIGVVKAVRERSDISRKPRNIALAWNMKLDLAARNECG
jgi:hypothetical protein